MIWIIILCLAAGAFVIAGREVPRRRYRRWLFLAALACIIGLIFLAYRQYSTTPTFDVSPIPADE